MSCTNCFNGCTEITSDKCVRYTGADIPELGIQNGDTLLFVEQTLAQFIISALDGSGIKPSIDPSIICSVVSANLPTCGEFNTTDLTTAVIKSICDLQAGITANAVSITEINAELATLNAPYSVPACIQGTVDNTDTHSVLQALLSNFCALVISLPNTYVPLTGPNNINDIINQELENVGLIGGSTKQYTKMVPYVAYPWFPLPGLLANFSGTGAGNPGSEYEYVYFCNGLNNTPDLRGRVLAGVTNGMQGNTLPADVNPSNSFNPNYTQGVSFGTNYVILGEDQMPAHSHTAISTAQPHFHDMPGNMLESVAFNTGFTNLKTWGNSDSVGVKTKNITLSNNVTVNTTIQNTGNNLAHQNNQPTIGCYYIMYIPA
jgi:microcystin-dependent protein